MDVVISPHYDVDADIVAPHGLIGQTFDRSHCPVHGRQDDYRSWDATTRELTTHSNAEGAIEGMAEDYQVSSLSSLDFKYTRFRKRSAAPRDTSRLGCHRFAWNGTSGARPLQLVPHLNFQGFDLMGGISERSPEGCAAECLERLACVAFTFITTPRPKRPLSTSAVVSSRSCWLKRKGFEAAAFHSAGTVSAVMPRDPSLRKQLAQCVAATHGHLDACLHLTSNR